VDVGDVEPGDGVRSRLRGLRPLLCAHAGESASRRWEPKYQVDGDARRSGPGFGLTLHEDQLDLPLRWRRPRTIFVNSMSDLFTKRCPDEFIARVFAVMGLADQHTFQF